MSEVGSLMNTFTDVFHYSRKKHREIYALLTFPCLSNIFCVFSYLYDFNYSVVKLPFKGHPLLTNYISELLTSCRVISPRVKILEIN